MGGRRFEIFRIFGFPIRIDLSWIIILLLVTYSLAVGYFPVNHPGMPVSAYWAMGFVAAIGLFLSILFHELSHSLMARHFKIQIDGITLFIFGGVAEMTEESPSPKVEFWVAVMGPVASILLALLFFKTSTWAHDAEINKALTLILYYLGFMNALLAFFNLVPAFPLDGGRIFRSIVWAIKKDFVWATRVSATLGQGFGWLLVAFGIYSIIRGNPLGGFWYILIGFFLKRASQMSYKQVLIQQKLQSVSVADLMDSHFISLESDAYLSQALPQLENRPVQTHYPVVHGGSLVGLLPLTKLQNLGAQGGAFRKVADLTDSQFDLATISEDQDAWAAFQKMRAKQLNSLFILKGKQVAGILTLDRLLALSRPLLNQK